MVTQIRGSTNVPGAWQRRRLRSARRRPAGAPRIPMPLHDKAGWNPGRGGGKSPGLGLGLGLGGTVRR